MLAWFDRIGVRLAVSGICLWKIRAAALHIVSFRLNGENLSPKRRWTRVGVRLLALSLIQHIIFFWGGRGGKHLHIYISDILQHICWTQLWLCSRRGCFLHFNTFDDPQGRLPLQSDIRRRIWIFTNVFHNFCIAVFERKTVWVAALCSALQVELKKN